MFSIFSSVIALSLTVLPSSYFRICS